MHVDSFMCIQVYVDANRCSFGYRGDEECSSVETRANNRREGKEAPTVVLCVYQAEFTVCTIPYSTYISRV